MGPLVVFSTAGLNGEWDRSRWVYILCVGVPGFCETCFDNVAETAAKTASRNGGKGDNPLDYEESGWDRWPQDTKQEDAFGNEGSLCFSFVGFVTRHAT
jgi:hypothetical protein